MEETVNLTPGLYLFVNKLDSLSPERLNLSITRAMVEFYNDVEEQREDDNNPNRKNVSRQLKMFKEWLTNDYKKHIYIKYGTAKTCDEVLSSVLVKDLALFADAVEEKDYQFTVESREVAQLLIKENNGYEVVGELKDGKVQMIRPEILVTFAFIENINNPEFIKIIDDNF